MILPTATCLDDDEAAESVLAACGRGELSPPLALTRLLLLTSEPARLGEWLQARRDGEPAAAVLGGLLERHGETTAAVLRLAAAEPGNIEACARLFDRAAAASPVAAVAAYSLGDEALLAAATAELVDLLDRLGALGMERRLLDIGCGIGRLEAALAPRVRAITGIDVSAGMIGIARARCAGLANVVLQRTSGRDLGPFADAAFDTVLAVDCFPYLFQAGGPALAQAQVAEAARVLRAGGDLVVLNLSYRGALERDRADARAMAAAAGFDLLRDGTADLKLWDGRTYHFRRAG